MNFTLNDSSVNFTLNGEVIEDVIEAWVLSTGLWNDEEYWDDDAYWYD